MPSADSNGEQTCGSMLLHSPSTAQQSESISHVWVQYPSRTRVRQSGSPSSSPSATSVKHSLSAWHTEPASSSGRLVVPAVFPVEPLSSSPPHDVTASHTLAKQLKSPSFLLEFFMDMVSGW
jgi:hypothetical protein